MSAITITIKHDIKFTSSTPAPSSTADAIEAKQAVRRSRSMPLQQQLLNVRSTHPELTTATPANLPAPLPPIHRPQRLKSSAKQNTPPRPPQRIDNPQPRTTHATNADQGYRTRVVNASTPDLLGRKTSTATILRKASRTVTKETSRDAMREYRHTKPLPPLPTAVKDMNGNWGTINPQIREMGIPARPGTVPVFQTIPVHRPRIERPECNVRSMHAEEVAGPGGK